MFVLSLFLVESLVFDSYIPHSISEYTLISISRDNIEYFYIHEKLRLYVSMKANAMLAEPFKFIGKITTMGEKKMIIYVPLDHHKEILKRWGKQKQVKVTLEDAV